MSEQPLRIATFNIHHAEGMDKVVDIRRTAEVIKGLNVDLIALQELDRGTKRSHGTDQPETLAELLDMHVFFAPALGLDPGDYGIALAGREEFEASVQQLPRMAREEPRLAIVARWNGSAVVSTHLSRNEKVRKVQTEHIAELAGRLGDPLLVLGDLNQPEKELIPLTARGLSLVRPDISRPRSLRPGWRIDHILVSQEVEVLAAQIVPTRASDHSPVVAEITLG